MKAGLAYQKMVRETEQEAGETMRATACTHSERQLTCDECMRTHPFFRKLVAELQIRTEDYNGIVSDMARLQSHHEDFQEKVAARMEDLHQQLEKSKAALDENSRRRSRDTVQIKALQAEVDILRDCAAHIQRDHVYLCCVWLKDVQKRAAAVRETILATADQPVGAETPEDMRS